MSTNYYWFPNTSVAKAAEPEDGLHIGKAATGWAFMLHVYPERGILDLQEWRRLLSIECSVVRDEYGNDVEQAEMLARITTENNVPGTPLRRYLPCGAGGRCMARGDGPWDCLTGDFS